jgi:small-conductance mechanosensitive channel/CRP-like cAMP-binding protein
LLNLVVAAFIFAILYVAATALVSFLASWHNRARGGQLQALHRGLLKWLLVAAGFLLYLKALGFSLTPLLFGMGAASIVVGLALQEPLSNLFAGLALDMEGAIEQGDWVRVDVDGGTVGKVIDKGWRTTRLLTLEQELITLPNRVMGGQKILNFQRPEPQHAHRLRVGASYEAPPVKVKEVLRTILLREPRILREPPPVVRTMSYGDSSIEYEMRFFLADYGQHGSVKDEILTRVWYAFRYNGIEIPFPIRTVHLKERPQLDEERESDERGAADLAHYLAELPYLAKHLLPQDFDFLGRNGFQRHYAPGEPIVLKGTMGDALFVVRDKWCEVSLPGGGRKRLESGEYFGEMALLQVGPRMANVLAGEEGATVVRLDRESIVRLFRYYPALRQEFEHTKEARHKEAGIGEAEGRREVERLAVRFRRAARNLLVPW